MFAASRPWKKGCLAAWAGFLRNGVFFSDSPFTLSSFLFGAQPAYWTNICLPCGIFTTPLAFFMFLFGITALKRREYPPIWITAFASLLYLVTLPYLTLHLPTHYLGGQYPSTIPFYLMTL